jgi:hypothetical protein
MRVLKFQTDDGSMHAVDLTQVHRIIQDQFGVIFLSGASFHLSTPYKSFEQVLDVWQGCDEQGKPVDGGSYATREDAIDAAKHRRAFDESWERQTQAAEKPKWPENWRQVPYDGGENPVKPNCPGCGAAWLTHHAATCNLAQGVNSGVAQVTIGARLDAIERSLDQLHTLAFSHRQTVDEINDNVRASFPKMRQHVEKLEKSLDTILARLATIQPNGGNAPGPLFTKAEAMKALEVAVNEQCEYLSNNGDFRVSGHLQAAFKRLQFP